MQLVSLVIGIIAIVGWLIALVPCLGWLNWINIPLAAVGLVLGIVALATDKSTSKGMAIGAIILCAIAVFFGLIRLIMGGGVV